MAIQNHDPDFEELFNSSVAAFDSAGKMSSFTSVQGDVSKSSVNTVESLPVSSEETKELDQNEGVDVSSSSVVEQSHSISSDGVDTLPDPDGERVDAPSGENPEFDFAEYVKSFFNDCSGSSSDLRVSLSSDNADVIRFILFANRGTSVFSYVNNILSEHFARYPQVVNSSLNKVANKVSKASLNNTTTFDVFVSDNIDKE